jgi:2,5-diketo-D-gluconate reductase A
MPYFANEEVRAYGREHGIATEAWSQIELKAKQHCVFHAHSIAVGSSVGADLRRRWHVRCCGRVCGL